MCRQLGKIELEPAVREQLLSLSRSRSGEHRSVIRSKIILMLADGKKYEDVEQHLGVSRHMLSQWKKRFMQLGIEGLKDQPRPGKPRKYDAYMRVSVIQRACEKPSNGNTNWSQRKLAEEFNVCQTTIFNILKEHDLQPHKVEYWCGKSRDPQFEEKMLDVVGLYLNPPVNAIVLSVDEKTQMQALSRTQPELPARPGDTRKQTATYKRNGTLALMAALEVQSGKITAKTIENNNSQTFLEFLKDLDCIYEGKELHIIADNLSAHKNKDVLAWVESKENITMHFTPTYSSWLNQIEIWFNIFTRDVIKYGVWDGKEQMTKQVLEYIKYYNENRAKPFCWKYDGKSNRTLKS